MFMKLPFSFGKKEANEYFLSLLLADEKVSACVFVSSGDKLRVIGEKEQILTPSIETMNFEELLDILDKTISYAESSLPENVETHKTIFGLKETWIENASIKKDYLVKLKRLSEELELTPIGFLIIQEAIAHLLEQEEGAPVSAVLVEKGEKESTVSLLRAGKIMETKRTKIEDDPAKTVDRLLHHFSEYEVLPSRIIILNQDPSEESTNEKIARKFTHHTWSKSLPFLHVPQIKILQKSFDAKAVIFGAATQMGLRVDLPEEKPSEDGADDTKKNKDENYFAHDDSFGFVQNQDIAHLGAETGEEKQEEKIDSQTIPQHEQVEHQPSGEKRMILSDILGTLSTAAVSVVSFMKTWINRIPIPNILGGKKIVLLIPAGILILLLLFFSYMTLVKAEVKIHVSPKIVEKKQNVLFSTEGSDIGQHTIGAGLLTVSKDSTITTPATGKKEVGEKAKGNVTIYNSSLSGSKNFPKGTIITGPNDLEFVLDDSVTVASASGDASSIKSSTTKVNMTASAVGKESNLPSGTKFTVGGESESVVVAKNDASFSGGTKKEVTVVARGDVDKLTDQLTKDLGDDAQKDLNSKVGGDVSLLPIFTDVTVSKQTFNKKVGEETATLQLKGTATFSTLSFENAMFKEYIKQLVAKDASELTVNESALSYELKSLKAENEQGVSATVTVQAELVPKIDKKSLKEMLAGKSFASAQDEIKKLPLVNDVEITLAPNLPFLPNLLPRNPNNIIIVVEK